MFAHQFGTAEKAFEYLYDLIIRSGEMKPDGTKVIRNVNIELVNPGRNQINTPWRKWKKDYAELEYEWYLLGDRNPDLVAAKAKLWDSMRDNDGNVWSNYGYWWQFNSQLNNVIEMLKKNPMTRRAIISHYDPGIPIENYEKDTPCNLILNFWQHMGDLNLTVFARSIDLVYGFCNDQYCFSKLLMDVAIKTKCHLGSMTYMITDLHIYRKHWTMKLDYL